MTKIIFMGTPDFSTTVLEMLIAEHDVIAVVTQPDRPVGRKRVMTPPPVKKVAMKYDLPVYQPEKLSGSEELEQLLQLDVDLIVTVLLDNYYLNHCWHYQNLAQLMYMHHCYQSIEVVHQFIRQLSMVNKKPA